MPNKSHLLIVSYLFFLTITSCSLFNTNKPTMSGEMLNVLILGSAEHPDPVLEMVKELESKGVIKDVIVRESYPVQIQVTGPKDAIKLLQAIPRKLSPGFK